jgi:hypothetical protein
LLWSGILVEGEIIVGFVWFFSDVANGTDHLPLILVLGFAVLALLVIVWCLDNPFRGPARLARVDFERARNLAGEKLQPVRASRFGEAGIALSV